MEHNRRFRLEDLDALAIPELHPPIGIGGALVWRYTLLIPISEGAAGEQPAPLEGALELCNDIMQKLSDHFRGLTVLPLLQGYGLRDSGDPKSIETNVNLPIQVLAAPIAAADKYFETLQDGVRDALQQGLVLVERQDVFLLGRYHRGSMALLSRTAWQIPGNSTGGPFLPA
jgi:hypothetical protein